MDAWFRFIVYSALGLSCEIISSVFLIEFALGAKVHRRVPGKYLEGFVSLYMIPIHDFGVLFAFEPMVFLLPGCTGRCAGPSGGYCSYSPKR
jgi:hypothetical protein